MSKQKIHSWPNVKCKRSSHLATLNAFHLGYLTAARAIANLVLAVFFYVTLLLPLHAQSIPWSSQSRDQLQSLADGGSEFRRPNPKMRTPMEEIHRRLGGFDLSYNSSDLSDACEVYNDLQRQISNAEETLMSAFSSRMDRYESSRDDAPRYWGLLEQEPQDLIDIAYELSLLSAPRLFLGGFGETICFDLKEPKFELHGIYSGAEHSGPLMMFHAENPDFSARPISDVFQALKDTSDPSLFREGTIFEGLVQGIEADGLEELKFVVPRSEIPNRAVVGYSLTELQKLFFNGWISSDISRVSTIEKQEYLGEFSFGLGEAIDLLQNTRKGRLPSIFISNVDLDGSGETSNLGGVWRSFTIDESVVQLDLSKSTIENLDVRNSTIAQLLLHDSKIESFDIEGVVSGHGWNRISMSNAEVDSANFVGLEGRVISGTYSDGEGYKYRSFLTLELDGAVMRNLSVQKSALESIEAQRINVKQSIWVSEVIFYDRMSFRRSSIDRFIMRNIEAGREILSDGLSEQDRAIYLNDSSSYTVEFQNVAARRLSAQNSNFYSLYVEDSFFSSLSLWGTVIDREVHLEGTSVEEKLSMQRVRTDGLRLIGGTYGNIYFWGADLGTSLIAPRIANELGGWYIKARAIEIESRDGVDLLEIKEINIVNAQIETALRLSDIQAEQVSLTNSRSNSIFLSCISVKQKGIDLVAISSNDIYLENITAPEVNFDDAQGGLLHWNDVNDALHTLPTPKQGVSDGVVDCDKGDVASVDFAGAQFKTVRISGHISKTFRASDLRTQSLIFFPNRVSFGDGAQLLLHSSDIGRLGIPLGMLKSKEDRVVLGLGGSDIGRIFLADPKWDGYANGVPSVRSEPPDLQGDEIAQPLASVANRDVGRGDIYLNQTEENYRQFLIDELLGSIVYSTDPGSKLGYNASHYEYLRDAATVEGFPGLAREIAILQNHHFTEEMPWVSSKLYRFIGSINQYGYNNARAISFLIGIYCIGFSILVLEYIRDRRSLLSVGRENEVEPFWPKVFVDSLFMSMDRTVPTLSVDEEYSRPVRAGVVENRPVWVIAWLYSQRTLAFLVAVALIGGVFDVFQ